MNSFRNKRSQRIITSRAAHFSYFLACRAKFLNGADNTLPDGINSMVNFLIKEDQDFTELHRHEILANLCTRLAKEHSRSLTFEFLRQGRGKVNQLDRIFKGDFMTLWDKVAAAASLNKPVMFRRLLAQLPGLDKWYFRLYSIYGDPLEITAKYGRGEVIKQFRSEGCCGPSTRACDRSQESWNSPRSDQIKRHEILNV
jgi:hypothetical protein